MLVSAPDQKTLPNTAASSTTSRSTGGSVSSLAATIPRMLDGSSPALDAALDERRCQLFDEERVPFRLRCELVRSSRIGTRRDEQASAELLGVILAEALEWKCDIGGEAASPRGPLGGELGTRERQEHEGNVAHPRRKCLEQVEHARRRDVDVVEDEHRRPIERERLHEPSRGEEQRLSIADAAVLADADQHRDVGRELGRVLVDERSHRSAQLFARRVVRVGVEHGRHLLHLCGKGAVGRHLSVGQRPAANHPHPGSVDEIDELGWPGATSRSRPGRRA